VPFSKVIEAALEVRRTLDRAGADSFCKTSGKRGLHVFVPLGARYSYEQCRSFAEIIANLVQRKLPSSTSVVRSPALRQRRVYLDYLQNRRSQTLAAPYSVRPYPGATVSTPLRWSEVRNGLDPSKFTMRTMPKRLQKLGDLWAPVLGPGIDLTQCLARLLPKD
jgi:bifunctional non-homologous end joining protein LigD